MLSSSRVSGTAGCGSAWLTRGLQRSHNAAAAVEAATLLAPELRGFCFRVLAASPKRSIGHVRGVGSAHARCHSCAGERSMSREAGTHLHHGAVYRRATVRDMARNRKRRASKRPQEPLELKASKRRVSSPGARVARVAVDDETWEAFRALCGGTPASVRIGQLVKADVRRAAAGSPSGDASAALTSIRQQVEALEAIVAVGGSEPPPRNAGS